MDSRNDKQKHALYPHLSVTFSLAQIFASSSALYSPTIYVCSKEGDSTASAGK